MQNPEKKWTSAFHTTLALGVIIRAVMSGFAVGALSTQNELHEDFSVLTDIMSSLCQPFFVTAYLICIGSWFKLYFTLTELRSMANASVPDLFKKKEKRYWPKVLVMPICITLAVSNSLICLILFLVLRNDILSSVDSEREEIRNMLLELFASVFFLISILYGVYAVLLSRLFSKRIYGNAARTIIRRVVILCILLSLCFFLRGLVYSFLVGAFSQQSLLSRFLFMLLLDIFPIASSIWLQAKNSATIATTKRSSRAMYSTN